MKSLSNIIEEAETKKIAIGHFNISDLSALKAIFETARNLNLPIIVGASEGERGFMGVKQCVALIRSLREEYDYPIFLNADHTHSFEKVREAVEAGFDAILFDGGKMPFEENIKETKTVVDFVKNFEPSILVEGELGYIGGGSTILNEIPEGAAINKEDMTNSEDAEKFVHETGVDLLGPAVGNIHGMLAHAKNPNLDIERIKEIKEVVRVPLVLHGGSGLDDNNFVQAIDAGIAIIHINTEIRLAWKKGLENALKSVPGEIVPYKILPFAIEEMKKVVDSRLRLFSKMI